MVAWLSVAVLLLLIHNILTQMVLTIYFGTNIGVFALGIISGDVTLVSAFESTEIGRILNISLSIFWLIYIWQSRRINVTCRSLVRSNDPILSEEDSLSEDMRALILAFIILGGLAFLIFLASNSPS